MPVPQRVNFLVGLARYLAPQSLIDNCAIYRNLLGS